MEEYNLHHNWVRLAATLHLSFREVLLSTLHRPQYGLPTDPYKLKSTLRPIERRLVLDKLQQKELAENRKWIKTELLHETTLAALVLQATSWPKQKTATSPPTKPTTVREQLLNHTFNPPVKPPSANLPIISLANNSKTNTETVEEHPTNDENKNTPTHNDPAPSIDPKDTSNNNILEFADGRYILDPEGTAANTRGDEHDNKSETNLQHDGTSPSQRTTQTAFEAVDSLMKVRAYILGREPFSISDSDFGKLWRAVHVALDSLGYERLQEIDQMGTSEPDGRTLGLAMDGRMGWVDRKIEKLKAGVREREGGEEDLAKVPLICLCGGLGISQKKFEVPV